MVSRVNLDYARRYAWWVLGICAVLLFLTLVVGIKVNGSRRWLGFGSLRVQVSEFAKLGLVFCLAHYLALNQTRIGELRRGFLYPLGIIGLIASLTLLEPDFGVAALMVAVGLVPAVPRRGEVALHSSHGAAGGIPVHRRRHP